MESWGYRLNEAPGSLQGELANETARVRRKAWRQADRDRLEDIEASVWSPGDLRSSAVLITCAGDGGLVEDNVEQPDELENGALVDLWPWGEESCGPIEG